MWEKGERLRVCEDKEGGRNRRFMWEGGEIEGVCRKGRDGRCVKEGERWKVCEGRGEMEGV